MGAPFIQSVLHPAGVQAARIEHLWWVLFWVCSVVFVAVVLAISIAAVRGRRGTSTATDATAARAVAVGRFHRTCSRASRASSRSACRVFSGARLPGFTWCWPRLSST